MGGLPEFNWGKKIARKAISPLTKIYVNRKYGCGLGVAWGQDGSVKPRIGNWVRFNKHGIGHWACLNRHGIGNWVRLNRTRIGNLNKVKLIDADLNF